MLNVVVIGGGFGGLKFLQRARSSKIQFTLIDKQNHHLFQPLLYQVATAVLSPANIAFPIRRMFKNFKNVKVILDEATDINREEKTVTISNGEKIKYDQLVVSTGSKHSYFGNDDWSEYSNGLKGINDALQIRERLLRAFEKEKKKKDIDKRNKYLNFVVVGGGPTGVEMAGSIAEIAYKNMKEEFRNFKSSDANVYLIEATEKILPMYSERLSGKAEKYLVDFGVEVRTNEKVIKIENDLVVTDKESIQTDNVIWAAGNEASPIIKKLNTKTDSEGRAIVDPDCSIKEDGNVFVIGDAANYKDKNNNSLPGIAPVAIQQGKYLAKIIKNKILKQDRKPFRYYDKGMMATVGRYKAIGKIGKIEVSGFIAWLFWSAIHILYLIGYRSKILVVIEWIFSYLFNKKGTRLIYREPT